MPTAMISMATLPCLIGLRTSRPRRLFGFNGLTDEAPLSPAACNDLGVCGLSSVTAPSILADERTFDLQGGLVSRIDPIPSPGETLRVPPTSPRRGEVTQEPTLEPCPR